ncbi:uncharacterized protein LOC117781654 [Drosophila innubila]|uniref:uncharacterized protein LOC117781654 n=1 Tax=Drosophila innubila TaxID=198719 RepID=UPI00148BF9B0|nr:uncharacterized protein LOC117781654 [Drosophila innubila]
MSKRKADNEMATAAQKVNPADAIQIVGDITINKSQPLEEYQKLINTRVAVDQIVDDDITKENFTKIAAAARDVIWQILFSDDSDSGSDADAAAESQKKASDLLEEYKGDACFYEPMPYNEWIVKLRDELLQRQQLDFWRDTIVKKQLGPCWSRDSDLFDSDDEPPLEFYAHAGCVAPFATSLKVRAAEKATSGDEDPGAALDRSNCNEAALTSDFEATISVDQPLIDYRDLMKRYVLTTCIVSDEIQQKNIDKIGQATRSTIWKLLFEGTPTQVEFDKAAELLQEYKGDAGFYGPWEFNKWIVKLRDEVLQREMLDFWGQKMVEMELGPCCARDSDYFDNMDEVPLEFYDKAGFKAPFDPSKNSKE